MTVFNKKGFTLIEMLIVIAIIGILSAAVLAGIGPARNKAKDARVISGMSQIRSIAEAVYNPSSGQPYSTLLDSDDFKKAKADIESQTGAGTLLPTSLQDGGATYLQYVKLLASDNYYCVDSTGFAGQVTSVPTGTECKGTTNPITP